MGQKVNPYGIRLGITTPWKAQWYARPTDYANKLCSDLVLRAYLEKSLKTAGVSSIVIERVSEKPSQLANIVVYVARPGVIIGKKGGLIERIKKELEQITGISVTLSIQEVRKPELDAKLVAESVAAQLERRILFRRAIKRAGDTAMKIGALGVKISVSGRLGGTDIARREYYQKGRMPLHTFRARINYGTAEAHTTYGVIGVEVLVFIEEIFEKQKVFDAFSYHKEENKLRATDINKKPFFRRNRGAPKKTAVGQSTR
jgi:small subunit ribosomal protein S3